VWAGLFYWLFILTRHVRVPVHERTVGVIAPCPDMQFKQARQAVAVRRAYVLQQLTLVYRRCLLVRRQATVMEFPGLTTKSQSDLDNYRGMIVNSSTVELISANDPPPGFC
jgi:hypothetical protein